MRVPSIVSTVARLKALKSQIIQRYARPHSGKAWWQVLSTVLPLALLWYGVMLGDDAAWPLALLCCVLMCLLLLRVFVLMHECGHGSLFASARLNRLWGFIFGVISGMPQYVWSQRHHFHHSTNGNWAKYRGPLCIIPVAEYAALNEAQQRSYRRQRSIWLAPLAGFMYLIFNPRVGWIKGSLALLRHTLLVPRAAGLSLRDHAATFTTPLWNSWQEYWHMLWNNVALFALWGCMAWAIGPAMFFACYLFSVSISGGIGILLFTVQHNFEESYASSDEGWDYDRAAIEGTSFLVLPRWLNWVTANIGYHHIHHLSARIPNYCLAACHEEYKDLFAGVTRIRLAQIPASLKCILWDEHRRRIVSVAEYQRQLVAQTA